MARKKSLAKRWDNLPKFVKVLPYVALSGALAGVVDYLGAVELDSRLSMAIVNIVLVILVEYKGKLKK